MNKKLLLLFLAPLSLSAANTGKMKGFFFGSSYSRNLFSPVSSPSDFDGDEAVIEKYFKMSPKELEKASNKVENAEDDRKGAKLEKLAAAFFKLKEREYSKKNALPYQKAIFFSSEVDGYWCSEGSPKLTRDNFNKWAENETTTTE